MQPPGLQHRKQAPTFVDRTPKEFEITVNSSPASADMIKGMGLGAGPLYTNAIMGQVPSKAEREIARKAGSTILREDSIVVEETENLSRLDSWSIHCNYTGQAPYSETRDDDMSKFPDHNAILRHLCHTPLQSETCSGFMLILGQILKEAFCTCLKQIHPAIWHSFCGLRTFLAHHSCETIVDSVCAGGMLTMA